MKLTNGNDTNETHYTLDSEQTKQLRESHKACITHVQGDHSPDTLKFPDISLTCLKFPDISRFSRLSRQVVTLYVVMAAESAGLTEAFCQRGTDMMHQVGGDAG